MSVHDSRVHFQPNFGGGAAACGRKVGDADFGGMISTHKPSCVSCPICLDKLPDYPSVTPGAVQGGPLDLDREIAEAKASLVTLSDNAGRAAYSKTGMDGQIVQNIAENAIRRLETIETGRRALRSSPPGPARPVDLRVDAHGSVVEFKWINLDNDPRTIRADFPLRVANEIAYRINSFNPVEPPKVEGKGVDHAGI